MGRAVTGKVQSNLPADFDAIDRECRFACCEFIDRDGERMAQFAGLSAHTLNRMREYVPDVTGPLSKLKRLIRAGRMVGRTDADIAALLRPLTDEAKASLVFDGDGGEPVEVLQAVSEVIREAGEALSVVIERAPGGFDAQEVLESVKEIDDVMDKCRKVKAALFSASTSSLPMRGKQFA